MCEIGDKGLICKISDFGLSKILKEDIYQKSIHDLVSPIKWTAPEVLISGTISLASDVWSFGVVLFELFSKGTQPWENFHNHAVIDSLRRNETMPISGTINLPEKIKDLMKKCFDFDPKKRLSFAVNFNYFFSNNLFSNFFKKIINRKLLST